MPHLFAGIIALGLAAIIFFAAQRVLFLWAHRRYADCTTTARETFDAEGCPLALRVYRKMLVL
jgi:hypothetical protein